MDWVDFITRVLVPIGAIITAIVSLRKANFEGKGVIYSGFEKLTTLHQAEIKRLEEQNDRQRTEHDAQLVQLKQQHAAEIAEMVELHKAELTRVLQATNKPTQEA